MIGAGTWQIRSCGAQALKEAKQLKFDSESRDYAVFEWIPAICCGNLKFQYVRLKLTDKTVPFYKCSNTAQKLHES